MLAVKGLMLLLLVIIGLLAIVAVLYIFARWIYNTWISDNAAEKAEMRALIEELETKLNKKD